MAATKTCSVISHTHWDREWYLGFESFRLRLVDLIDGVLDILDAQSAYVFHLDAQTIVLDDYLEIRPQARPRLRTHIASGRLLLGPWYVQNDFFLTSGEATFRNLKLGMARAEAFGGCMKVGYMPDQFGLAGQLPQVLRNFGIPSAVFGRGYTFWEKTPEGTVHRRQPTELWWDSPDGSRVLGVHLCNWYNNAQRFSADLDKSTRYVHKIVADLGDRPQTSQLLFMNGVDHLEAQPDLLPILAGVQKRLTGLKLEQTSLPEYLAAVRRELEPQAQVPVWRGELRQGADYDLLVGTLSSRIYLKVLNVRAQNTLEKALEPLFALAEIAGLDGLSPNDELAYAWRLLMQNHPHDSICGCSVDAVHDRMEDRYARLTELSLALADRCLHALQSHTRSRHDGAGPGGFTLLVVNTLGWARSSVVRCELFFPADLGDVSDFLITAPDGQSLAYHIVATSQRSWASLSPVNLPGTLPGRRFTVEFLAGELPAWGWKLFTVTPGQAGLRLAGPPLTPARTDHHTLDNGLLRVLVGADGKVDLQATDGSWARTDVLHWLDEADAGDSYVHRGAGGVDDVLGFAGPVQLSREGSTPLRQVFQVKGVLLVPSGWDFAAARRSAHLTGLSVTLELALTVGSARLQGKLTVHNTAQDHRLRAVFRLGGPLPSAWASAPFELVERPFIDPDRAIRNRDEPTSGLIHLGAWSLLTEGLHEYELLDAARGEVALTVLRATGRIGADVGTPDTAPEIWLCPGGQCLRTLEARFVLCTPSGRDQTPEAALRALDEEFTPPLVRFDAADPLRLTGGRPAVQESDLREVFTKPDRWPGLSLPSQASMLQLDSPQVQVSAVYALPGATLVRLYNPTGVAQACRLTGLPALKAASVVNGREEFVSALAFLSAGSATAVELVLAPHQILTLKLERNAS